MDFSVPFSQTRTREQWEWKRNVKNAEDIYIFTEKVMISNRKVESTVGHYKSKNLIDHQPNEISLTFVESHAAIKTP